MSTMAGRPMLRNRELDAKTLEQPPGHEEGVFRILCWVALFLPISLLVLLFVDALRDALPRLNWQFLSSFPSRHAEVAGILSALVGSAYLILLTAVMVIPAGVGA
ncbi:MAG: hypothetical protein AB7O65_05760, partial [Candidatus Korobacteraceae bacterium]